MIDLASCKLGVEMGGQSLAGLSNGKKTQTRRLCRVPQSLRRRFKDPIEAFASRAPVMHGDRRPPVTREEMRVAALRACPYGDVGDRLWVKEIHAWADRFHDEIERDPPCTVWYQSDLEARFFDIDGPRYIGDDAPTAWNPEAATWRRARWMPRWATRWILTLTERRLEPLQLITHDDARREGCDSVEHYASRWDELHKAAGTTWASNPPVWVISYTATLRTAPPEGIL